MKSTGDGSGDDLLTFNEALGYCRLRSRFLLNAALRRHEIEAVRIGHRTVLFRRAELDRWLASKKTKIIK